MDDTLKDDPINRIRSMNALSRLSREALVFRKYEDALAKEQPDLSSKAGGTDSPSKEEIDRQLRDKSDDFFGLKSPARLQAEWQAAAAAHSSPSYNGKDEFHLVPNISPASEPASTPPSLDVNPRSSLIGNSSLEIDSSLEITPSSLPVSEIETQKSKIKNPNESAICDLPSAISEPTAMAQSNAENPVPSPGGEGQGEGERSDRHIETQKSKIENSSEQCHSCKSFLPALLENGDRPREHCDTCGSYLRHPKLLYLYCPHCSQRMDEIFDGTTRLSDHCPKCLESLVPTPEQTAHAE